MDGNGRAMPGAKLYFYQTGTSTLQDTYSDAGLTQANANPVVADGNGLFGPIYLGTTSDYKVVLKTAADVTVYTVDPYFANGTSGRTAVDDVNYTATVSDRFIAYTAISAARTVTLPAALNFPAGTVLTLVDEAGQATSSHTISLAPDGDDTINGSNSSIAAVKAAYGSVQLESDGNSKWTMVTLTAGSGTSGQVLTTDGTTPSWSNPGFTTGDLKLTLKTAADAGWVMCDDGTIGSASSGATTRANADTSALYTLLWTNMSDSLCPVTGGRGSSALADFGANKPIALTKMLGRALVAAGAGSGLTSRTLGDKVGAESNTGSGTTNDSNNSGSGAPSGTGNQQPQNHNHNFSVSVSAMQPSAFINVMLKL
jgi:hypothetical protein